MAKITFDIEATSGEITEIISGVLKGLGRKPTKVQRTRGLGGGRRRQSPVKGTLSRTGFSQQRANALREGKLEGPVPPNVPQKGFRYWTKEETAWLAAYAKNNAMNDKVVKLFAKAFGYERTFSSLRNKVTSIQRKNR